MAVPGTTVPIAILAGAIGSIGPRGWGAAAGGKGAGMLSGAPYGVVTGFAVGNEFAVAVGTPGAGTPNGPVPGMEASGAIGSWAVGASIGYVGETGGFGR
ncbi:MAG: hypothetical protein ACI9HK_000970 [Pirellulaceae bacterium]|jgi:hypothetical protein